MTTELKKVKFPIGLKLILIITSIVLISLGIVAFIVSYFTGEDTQIVAEQNNHTINLRSATSVESELNTIRANSFLLLDMISTTGTSAALSRQASAFFFERNQDIAAIILYNGDANQEDRMLINNRFFLSNELESSLVATFLKTNSDILQRTCAGEVFILSGANLFQAPVLVMLYPWTESGRNQAAVLFFSSEMISSVLNSSSASLGITSENLSFLVNHDADLLVHSDFELVKAGANFANMPIIQEMRENNDENRQIIFTNTDGIEYFGAYKKLSIGDCGLITIIPTETVMEPVYKTLKRILFIVAAVLFIAILFIYFFSKTISNPVKKLAAASDQIESGDFELNLKSKSKDEIGLLTERFVSMGKGLAERERLKDTFGRFINKDIAEKAAKGELTLGGDFKKYCIPPSISFASNSGLSASAPMVTIVLPFIKSVPKYRSSESQLVNMFSQLNSITHRTVLAFADGTEIK